MSSAFAEWCRNQPWWRHVEILMANGLEVVVHVPVRPPGDLLDPDGVGRLEMGGRCRLAVTACGGHRWHVVFAAPLGTEKELIALALASHRQSRDNRESDA